MVAMAPSVFLCCPLLLQNDMFAKAKAEFDSCIETVWEWDDFVPALDRKHMVLAPW
jgi:prolyl-tRNA synthetase